MKRKAIVIGATGLVGMHLVKQLSLMYDTLIIVARKPPEHIYNDMMFYQLGDFKNLDKIMSNISIGSDTDAFSCLGTTIKQAGSEPAFEQVDYGFNLNFATLCRNKGVQRFFLLSALGADLNSRFFYNRVKGRIENAIRELQFNELVIFRPSMLLGKHKGRVLENTAQSIFKVISPIIPKSVSARPIKAERVAAAMALTSQNIYERHKYTEAAFNPDRVTEIDNKQLLAMTQLTS